MLLGPATSSAALVALVAALYTSFGVLRHIVRCQKRRGDGCDSAAVMGIGKLAAFMASCALLTYTITTAISIKQLTR